MDKIILDSEIDKKALDYFWGGDDLEPFAGFERIKEWTLLLLNYETCVYLKLLKTLKGAEDILEDVIKSKDPLKLHDSIASELWYYILEIMKKPLKKKSSNKQNKHLLYERKLFRKEPLLKAILTDLKFSKNISSIIEEFFPQILRCVLMGYVLIKLYHFAKKALRKEDESLKNWFSEKEKEYEPFIKILEIKTYRPSSPYRFFLRKRRIKDFYLSFENHNQKNLDFSYNIERISPQFEIVSLIDIDTAKFPLLEDYLKMPGAKYLYKRLLSLGYKISLSTTKRLKRKFRNLFEIVSYLEKEKIKKDLCNTLSQLKGIKYESAQKMWKRYEKKGLSFGEIANLFIKKLVPYLPQNKKTK